MGLDPARAASTSQNVGAFMPWKSVLAALIWTYRMSGHRRCATLAYAKTGMRLPSAFLRPRFRGSAFSAPCY